MAKINIIDPGSATQIVETKAEQEPVFDKVGLAYRTHEPLGACYVAAYTIKQGHEVSVISPTAHQLSVEEALSDNPEYVAFSAMTYNYSLALEVAKRIKQKKPEIVTVLGGYHATCLPKETSQGTPFDYVVAREADWTLSDLVEYFEGKRNGEKIRGTIYKDGLIFIDNFQRLDPNLNPIPFRTKEMMKGRKRFEIFDLAPSEQKGLALIVGSRGCDYGCKFCLSSSMFPSDNQSSRTRYRDVGNIIDEINDCKKRFGTNALFFVDLNFYGGTTGRVRELCKALAKTGINWYAMSRVDASPETFEEMKKGGCLKVGLGIESLVKPLKSGVDMPQAKWQEFVRERTSFLRELGILTKGYFILNDYSETERDLDEETYAMQEAGLDEIRLSFMIYSPGTVTFNKLVTQNRFVTTDFSKFSTDYPVIKNPDLTPEELLAKRKDIYRKFYTSPKYGDRVRQTLMRFPKLNRAYSEFNDLLVENLGRGFSL